MSDLLTPQDGEVVEESLETQNTAKSTGTTKNKKKKNTKKAQPAPVVQEQEEPTPVAVAPVPEPKGNTIEPTPVSVGRKKVVLGDIASDPILTTVFKVRFAHSTGSKKFNARRDMTLYTMFDTFIKNRYTFIGLRTIEDYVKIEEFLLKNDIVYDHQNIEPVAIEQFLGRLKENTEFCVERYGNGG